VARYLNHEGPPPGEEPPPKEKEDARQAGEVGAAAPPTDVDTTGSSPEIDPLAATTAPDDWTQNPYVQLEGGFLAGVSLGLVPAGGVGHQLADAGELLPHGTPEARFGLAVGMIVGGMAITVGGFTGEVLGGAATTTGIGAAVGVPAMVVSTTLVVGGAGNVAAGIRGLSQSMMSKGSGSQGTPPTTEGGVKLTGGGQKVLRDPALRDMKDLTLAEAIKARGGGGQQIQQVSNELRNKALGEVANMAAQGNREAETAIKLVKQAVAKAQKYGGK
jgi:hypothetical protein